MSVQCHCVKLETKSNEGGCGAEQSNILYMDKQVTVFMRRKNVQIGHVLLSDYTNFMHISIWLKTTDSFAILSIQKYIIPLNSVKSNPYIAKSPLQLIYTNDCLHFFLWLRPYPQIHNLPRPPKYIPLFNAARGHQSEWHKPKKS